MLVVYLPRGAPGSGRDVPGPGGCTWPGGVPDSRGWGCTWSGGVPGPGGSCPGTPPVNRMTDRRKNITFLIQ